jgi:hypothetical protein
MITHAEIRNAARKQYQLTAGEGATPADDTVLMTYIREREEAENAAAAPIPMRLPCPDCGQLHIDVDVFAEKPHHTHACQHCGLCWRPAVVATVGVQFLPGFKNGAAP